MLMAASEILAQESPLVKTGEGDLLPPLNSIVELSKKIAFAVSKVAFKQQYALAVSDEVLSTQIEKNFWQPNYRQYRRVSI
jgi:malate dehydrogenase (oxaloacetate-decarboxylating)